MPISELEKIRYRVESTTARRKTARIIKKWTGMDFNIAAEEMRRLQREPTDEEKLQLYGLYKQAVHGDIPPEDIYERPTNDEVAIRKYNAWAERKGQSQEAARADYVLFAEEMIRLYHRTIIRFKWNSEVWSVDY
ncbi:acyl CoA binding protein [Ancylostoma caninum]|uniref:Acyl CoA binding protein n=1 Tax=Ancylostoma caninum TaxID=29170 RepID=A0A368GJU8_ANCCA|nr:acyl CoA binding protein [Ancylostoma caninum]